MPCEPDHSTRIWAQKKAATHHYGAAQGIIFHFLKDVPAKAEIGEPPAAPPLIVAKQFYLITLEEGELGAADYALHSVAQVVGGEAVGLNLWGEDFSEGGL